MESFGTDYGHSPNGSGCGDPTCCPAQCGSEACAAGWATQIPAFRRAGLKQCSKGEYTPQYKEAQGFRACEEFFHLTSKQSDYLFDPGYYGEITK